MAFSEWVKTSSRSLDNARFCERSHLPPLCSVCLCVVQNGTEESDEFMDVAADKNGRFLIAGRTSGQWNGFNSGGYDFAGVLFNAQSTLPPAPSPTSPPSAGPPGLSTSPSPTTLSPTAELPGLRPTLPLTISPSTAGFSGLSHTPSPTTFPSSVGPTGRSFSTVTIAVVVGFVVAGAAILLAVCLWCRVTRPKDEGRRRAREIPASQLSPSLVVDQSKRVILPIDNIYGPNVADKSIAAPPATSKNVFEFKKSAASAGREEPSKVVGVNGQDHVTVEGGGMLTTSAMATSMAPVALSASPLPCNASIDIIPERAILENATESVVVSRNSTVGAFPGGVEISAAVAIMDAASAVASSSSIPGVSEAARLVSVLVKLVVDSNDNDTTGDWRVRWCRSIVAVLERASELIQKVSEMSARMRRLSMAKYSLKTTFLSRRMNSF